MKPIPGSWTSRASRVDSSSRMASATRSGLLALTWLGAGRSNRSRGGRHSLHNEGFDDVADLDVVVLLEADAAFEPRLDLGHVVLEASQRADLAFVNDHVVAEQARLRVARTGDAPLRDHAAGDGAEL